MSKYREIEKMIWAAAFSYLIKNVVDTPLEIARSADRAVLSFRQAMKANASLGKGETRLLPFYEDWFCENGETE